MSARKKYKLTELLRDSAKELCSVRAIVVLVLLTACAVVLGSHFRMRINEDLRVSFSFICIMAAAVLFGPVSCMLCATVTDVIAYLLDKNEIRDYSLAILAVKLIVAFFYGVMLYKKYYGNFGFSKRLEEFFPLCVVTNIDVAVRSVISRTAAVLVGNIVLNSAVLYRLYRNGSFPFMSRAEWSDFSAWLRPRVSTNLDMLPFELATVFLLMPLIHVIYSLICGKKPCTNAEVPDNITKN